MKICVFSSIFVSSVYNLFGVKCYRWSEEEIPAQFLRITNNSSVILAPVVRLLQSYLFHWFAFIHSLKISFPCLCGFLNSLFSLSVFTTVLLSYECCIFNRNLKTDMISPLILLLYVILDIPGPLYFCIVCHFLQKHLMRVWCGLLWICISILEKLRS